MAKEKSNGITVKKEDDMSEWYSQVCLKSGFADYAPVKGCMIIRPLAYACWENLTQFFNNKIKKHDVENAYFPMFIPESFFKKEQEHAKGFNPEVAWIQNKDNNSERLAIRPTSETIMYDAYSKWIRSHRDLPLKINQWCNICRWEVQDVKLFLRSREFLWQEGHCVYETEEECEEDVLKILEDYRSVSEDLLAMPVMKGEKTEKERFAGAKRTFTIEGFMPDGKALQLGTSHNLGQGFAKAFNITYMDKNEKPAFPWQNSWGISTRMLGGMILTHSDNRGLVLPPNIAPNKVVIVPIFKSENMKDVIFKASELKTLLINYNPKLDNRVGYSPGWKFNEWELKGIPIRIELGPKDIANNQVVLVRRDTGEKSFVAMNDVADKVDSLLKDIQRNLFETAKKRRDEAIVTIDNYDDFKKAVFERKLIKTNFCCDESCENEIKDDVAATSRCIPLEDVGKENNQKCFHCGKDAKAVVYFAKNY